MSITLTATIKNDVNFTLIQLGTNTQNESASLNYSRALTDGVGSLQANYGVIASGNLPSGGKTDFDLMALNKTSFDVSSSVQFSGIKSIVVRNRETTYGNDINIHATGLNALSSLFNGESGNLLIKPYAVFQYSDPISGLPVDASNKNITLLDVSGSGAAWSLVVVGVTG